MIAGTATSSLALHCSILITTYSEFTISVFGTLELIVIGLV